MKREYNFWNKREMDYLKNNYGNLNIDELKRTLNHSEKELIGRR